MTARRGVAVVIRHVVTLTDGVEQTTLYGPFLPHVGGACTGMIARLHEEAWQRPDVVEVNADVLTVFVADGESDAVVLARDRL